MIIRQETQVIVDCAIALFVDRTGIHFIQEVAMLSFGWSNDAQNMVVLVAHHGNVIRRTGLRIVLSRSERKRRGFHHAIFTLPRMRRVRSVQRITAGNRIWYSLSRRRQHQVGMDGVQWCEEHGYNKTVFCQEMEGSPVTGVSQERNRSVVCSRIPPKSGM